MSHILQRVAPIGEARDREILKDAATYAYVERPEGPVQTHLFFPLEPATGPRPVIVFFHGGFWDAPTPAQFVPHCLHFRSRGAVAVAAETRCSSLHGTGPLEAIEDARELIRWLRAHADLFQIDPARIIVGGAAGGAFLALHTALPTAKQVPPIDGIGCTPQGLLLFSALVNTAKPPFLSRFPHSRSAKNTSPTRLLRRKLPPMVFFHGTSDRTTPFDEILRFRGKAKWRGNKCQVIDFTGADHSFFNFNVNHQFFELTLHAADRILADWKILPPSEESETEDF